LYTEGETVIGFGDVTAVTADSHSLTDTVGTDCLTVAAMNRRYCYHELVIRLRSDLNNHSISNCVMSQVHISHIQTKAGENIQIVTTVSLSFA